MPESWCWTEQGYWLGKGGVSDRYQHILGGPDVIAGAECTVCGQPMNRLLSLDASDPRLELADFDLAQLHLLLCLSCAPSEHAYGLRANSSVVPFLGAKGLPNAERSKPRYGLDRAQPIALHPLTHDERDLIRRAQINNPESGRLQEAFPRVCAPRSQVGGEPFLIQPDEQVSCPLCDKPMGLIAALFDDRGGVTVWHDKSFQYVYRACVSCVVLHCELLCD